MRGPDPAAWVERHDPSPLVRTGSGPPLALCLDSFLLGNEQAAGHERGRTATGAGDTGRDGSGISRGH